MFLRWLRRRRIRSRPFPPSWRLLLHRTTPFWERLTGDEQARMEDEIRYFIAERSWEGCGGLTLTETMQVVIAAQACRLLLGRPGERFAEPTTILVYPSGYFAGPTPTPILPGAAGRVMPRAGMPVLGQAHQRGPVILSWRDAEAGALHDDDGNNLVLHEFAHKLDMDNGAVDGTPRMDSAAQAREWHAVLTAANERLAEEWASGAGFGPRPPIRPYALTNPAEFFAVTTEVFFEQPAALAEWDPDLYRVFAAWYRQDPAAAERR
jgi:Mlc titration factor MtfA (ptsG expression regulator)